ncbi:MAG: alpha/beta hydrolase [Pseudomonadales bacterium]|nr:alpha/beta hydrolase [Pseudomonadales bacterium]
MTTQIAYKTITFSWCRGNTTNFLSTLLMICALPLLTAGCKSTTTEQNYAAQYTANLQYFAGNPYQHAIYVNPAAFKIQTQQQQKARFLHVYIEGDGKAFSGGKVSVNPTPNNPMLLKLMQQDEQPAIYLGRPCYFNPKDNQCSPNVWTRQRYSAKVVQSMLAALSHFSSDYEHVVLIGHSGGGTIATLMAAKEPKAAMLITLAGNLDIFSWALEHQYQPLKESLNPMDLDPLPAQLLQIHYAGANDELINPEWIGDFASKQKRAEFHQLLDIEHVDGWEEFWPQILEKLTLYQQYVKPSPKTAS